MTPTTTRNYAAILKVHISAWNEFDSQSNLFTISILSVYEVINNVYIPKMHWYDTIWNHDEAAKLPLLLSEQMGWIVLRYLRFKWNEFKIHLGWMLIKEKTNHIKVMSKFNQTVA